MKIAVHELVGPRSVGGEDAGNVQTIFMLHCAGFHGRAFGRIARAMSESTEHQVRILAPDLRGHGDTSPGPESSFTWNQMARDLVEVIKARNLEGKAIAVGHSLGAVVAMIAEIENPGIFRGLWCFEPVLFPELENGRKYSYFFASKATGRRSNFASYAEAIETFGQKIPTGLFHRDCLRDYVEGGFRQRAGSGGVELKCSPKTESRTYVAGYETFRRGFNSRIGELGCPVVLACGSNVGDHNEVSRGSDAFVGALRRGRLERYVNLGHFGPFEDPDFVARRILTFIEEDLEAKASGLPKYMTWNLSKI